jgi:hypothetical protein
MSHAHGTGQQLYDAEAAEEKRKQGLQWCCFYSESTISNPGIDRSLGQ